jgi:hypothetical protein
VKKVFVAAVVVIVVLAAACVLDRVTLLIWRYRIEAYHGKLQRSATQLARAHTRFVPGAVISWSGTRDVWQVPLLEVAFGGPAPTTITVDGNGGLNFLYAPPLLAWSRHVPWAFTRPAMQGSDTFAYNDVYILRIETLQGQPGGKELASPTVELEHGLPF